MTESPSLSSSLSLSFGTPVSSSTTPAAAAAAAVVQQALAKDDLPSTLDGTDNARNSPPAVASEAEPPSTGPAQQQQQQQQQSLAILSPFDEKEEWHKISKIIDSFGTDIGTDVKDSTTPNNCESKARLTLT